MRNRCLTLMGALVAMIGMVSLAPIPVAGQAATATPAAGDAASLRTPWGTPDLQGIWNGETLTPLERPARFAGKPLLTEQEAAQLAKDVTSRPGRDSRTERGSEKDVARAYNDIWQNTPTRLTDRRTALIVDPPDGQIPPFTPEAQKNISATREYLAALMQGTSGGRPGPISPRRAEAPPSYNVARMNRSDGPEDRSVTERCLGNQLPVIGTFLRLVQSPDAVAIFYDIAQGQGFSRIIPINGTPRLPSNVRQRYGDARAHWEGDTLVVEVINFTHKTDYYGSRENLRLIERFKRTDANTLTYQITVEDPTTWTRPWTAVIDLKKEDEKANQIYQQTCHEGNYGLVGVLSNTRAAEKAFAEGRGPDPATQDNATAGDAGGGIEREQ